MSRGPRALAVVIVATAAWAGPVATATAQTDSCGPAAGAAPAGPSGGFVIVDEPDDATAAVPAREPLARRTAAQVQQRALLEPELAMALGVRRGSTVRVRFFADERRWRVSVRARSSAVTLASAEVDDVSGCVIEGATRALPLGDYPPRSTERQAIDAAVADPRVRREARQWGGIGELRARGRAEGCCWEVDLLAPDRRDGDPAEPVIRADVVDASGAVTGVWTGIQVRWKMARGDRDAFGGDVNEPGIWLPLFALFALVMVDWSRLRSWANADVLAILALGVSHEAFLRGTIDWSVPLAIPPLLWLGARMAWLFVRGLPEVRPASPPRSRAGRLALRRVPTVVILVGCVALAGLRIGLTLDGGNVIDVGYAGVAGARLELQGAGPWGQMPSDNVRGDTYGPANYLAYVPATAALDDPPTDRWGSALPAAQITSIAADLGCALLLALIGWRWISRRGAALLAAGWLACPWTTWALAAGVNDALVALALLAAFAVVPRPLARGGLVGLAAMVKFAPLAALAPMLHVGCARPRNQALRVLAGAGMVVAFGLAWVVFRVDQGSVLADLRLFEQRTLGFQLGRDSPFSPWGLYGWDAWQRAAQVLVTLVLVGACLVPRARNAWQVSAGIAASLVLVQLTMSHWFYLYIPWFVGFVLIVLVAIRERPSVCSPAWTSSSEPRSSPPTGPAWEPSSPNSSRPGSTTSTGT